MPSRTRVPPGAVAAIQAAFLGALVVLGLQQAPQAGTVAAVVGAVLPPVALGAIAAIGWPGMFVLESRIARITYWTLEGLTVAMALFLAMALAGGLMFGGIISPEL